MTPSVEPTVGDRTRFLQKPFATVDLARAVRELLDAGGPPRNVRLSPPE